jgi:tRNA(Ile2) C34 agmatinyltransferase TiaS
MMILRGEDMRTKIALQNLKNNNIDDEIKDFLIQKLTPKPLVLNDQYGSIRCPNCNTTMISLFDKYCRQCGQRLKKSK